MTPVDHAPHYVRPGRPTRAFNAVAAFLVRRGVSVWGARVLTVRGRRSGEPRSTPVNLLALNGKQYLVAARGTTEWVRNLRAAGEGELRKGRKTHRFTYVELSDTTKPDILRAYLERWAFEVGAFFDGVTATSPADELARIAPKHPVFEITTTN